jgi:hypothetical protein
VYDFELFCGVSSANLFFKRTKNLIEESAILVGMFKIHFKPVRNPKQEKCGTCSDGERKYYYRKEKETLKVSITLIEAANKNHKDYQLSSSQVEHNP